jgi:hypothetical protein|tara:strand:+ start:809 stop:910 length:102 start_codon:yes stop_codon:yes gene_type:complete
MFDAEKKNTIDHLADTEREAMDGETDLDLLIYG